jgi:Predicted divalent heavy-metal cations transporter
MSELASESSTQSELASESSTQSELASESSTQSELASESSTQSELASESSSREPLIEARSGGRAADRVPVWALGAGVLAIIIAVLAGLAVFGGAALPERAGPPIEELAVERTVLDPGTISITVRNTGPDPVEVAQVFINDTYVDFTGAVGPIERFGSETMQLRFPWQSGQPYTVSLLTSTGLVIEHPIDAAVATPPLGAGLFGAMVLLGTYVGIIPVALGMLLLPVLRRTGRRVVRVLLAATVGLLGFLAVDAAIEGLALADASGGAFGGALLVVLGAALAFLALTAVDRILDRRTRAAGQAAGVGIRLAVMIAVGIGLHNLGEGLAIGSAYAVGELALGTALVVGFALHNTTEGLAIVSPLTATRPSLSVLAGLGVVAGAPAILGAVIGSTVDNAALSATLFGVGVGAIIQVIIQIAPGLRGPDKRLLNPSVVGGLAAGVIVMYLTGLLVAA